MHIKEYEIEELFNDGRKGVADLSDVLKGPVFKLLKNEFLFSKLKVDKELETVVWSNGVDLAPEYIYYQAFKNEPELQQQFIIDAPQSQVLHRAIVGN